MFAVYNMELAHIFNALEPFLLCFLKAFKICPSQCFQHLHVTFLVSCIFSVEILQDITDAEAIATYLIGICRANALTCSSHLIFTFGSLISAVEDAMSRHNQMSLL